MKSRNKKRLLALVLCMVVAISNSSFIFASETGQTEYPQEVQTQDEAVADDMDVVAYAADEGQAVAEEQTAPVEQVAEEPVAEPEATVAAPVEQPTAEAPAAEQPTTEAPAAETPAAQEPAAAPTEETAPASENATAETPEEDATQAEAENQQLTWSQVVGNTTVNVTAEAGALPADAQLSVTEITAEDEVKEIEKAVEEKAIEEQFSIKNIFSYDIKFLVNGSEVQPTTPVQVSVDTPEITSSENAAVLHVDDNNVAEDMKGAVDGEGKVVFDAPHFSKYVIVQKGGSEVTVTIEHYKYSENQTERTKLYADDVKELPVGGKINDYTKATNWTVSKVVQIETGTDGVEKETEIDTEKDFEVAKDCTIRVYYNPKSKEVDGSTTLYDYTVKAGENYSFNSLGGTAIGNQKLTAGAISQNYDNYQYHFTVGNKKANDWTGDSGEVITGLLNGIDAANNVKFNYPEPGFFVNSDAKVNVDEEDRYLRKVYTDYKLTFQQDGDTYELKSVKDSSGAVKTNAGANFFPLDDKLPEYEDSCKYKSDSGISDGDSDKHNYFFGMRYDVTFKIGDYVGPLNYSFTGDDDLWVVLTRNDNNAQHIVVDLGGIHNAATADVNLWEYIGNPESLSDEEKQVEYKLTVLYMERGAGKSNCKMNFTLPEARISEVTSVPMTDLVIQKVDSSGKKLQGAEFSLTNKVTGEKMTAKSVGTDGLAQFTKLRVGEYELKENAAPNGYIPSLESWIVKVTESNGSATATLYLSDGKTEYKNRSGSYYQILNVTKEEQINASLAYDKTAKVLDWDNRTYKIDITASSKLTESSVTEKDAIADMVLALDVSGSMDYKVDEKDDASYEYLGDYNSVSSTLDSTKIYYYTGYCYPMIYHGGKWIYYYRRNAEWKDVPQNSQKDVYKCDSRLSGLKEAATTFINSANAASQENRIGIVSFSTSAKIKSKIQYVNASGTDALVKAVNQLTADGGTSPNEALEKAADILEKNKRKDVPQYVILFTDGEPTGNGNTWKNSIAEATKLQADKLKQDGIIVYTVGLGLTSKAKGWLDGTQEIEYNGKNISGIASTGCAYTAENIEQLKDVLKKIQETTTQNLAIKKAEIKDVIDPRFVILDGSGTPITSEYPGIENGIKLANGGTVYYDKDTKHQYIVWTEQTIKSSKDGGWKASVTVKAKDDYIGGNDVPTNISPDSKIHTGYGDAVLPQPKVNVKAKLKVKDKAVTIYKGDNLPDTSTVLNEMFDLAGNTSKYSVPASSFTTKWYSNPECTAEVTDLTADTDTTYYLKVSYNAGAPSTKSNTNTNGNIAGGTDHIVEAVNENDSAKLYGIYAIKVVSGEIRITKKLESALGTECTFNFSIKNESTNETRNVSITIPAGSTEKTFADESLKNLPRGTYTISEVDSNGYVLTDYQIDDSSTNCRNTRNEEQESVIFKLGYEKAAGSDGKDVDVIKNYTYNENSGGTVGSVTFTNEKATTDWDIVKVSTSGNQVRLPGAEFVLQQKGKTVYTGTSNTDGKIIWKKEGEEVSSLEKGEYTLKETKAPTGYVLSNEEWTIKTTKGGSLVSYKTNKSQSEIEKSEITETDGTLHLYFKNEVVYDLPSTGHTGIFNILMSGILLMFAGILIIYKMKGKEVLKK